MSHLNTIIELEGPVVDVRPRFWAAHQAAIAPLKLQGPPEEEFWRLVRLKSDDSAMVPRGKAQHIADYKRVRDERLDSAELMALDELQPGAQAELRVLKAMGTSHLVTLSQNRDGVNATLNRLDVWLCFDQRRSLPADRNRRVAALRELAGGLRTLAVVGSVPMAYAAGEAGCRVVGVRCGQAFPRSLQQVGVDLVYDNLGELTEALSRHDPQLQRIGVL
jgi:phosphoglycolate phosphatase-like HAD superfamily hydrolase